MIEYRDRIAANGELNLVVGQNTKRLAAGIEITRWGETSAVRPEDKRHEESGRRKGYTGIISVCVRMKTAPGQGAVLSPRDKHGDWDFRDQPPELWDQFKTTFRRGRTSAFIRFWIGPRSTSGNTSSTKTFPSWICTSTGDGTRYCSLGCAPVPAPIRSTAKTVDEDHR